MYVYNIYTHIFSYLPIAMLCTHTVLCMYLPMVLRTVSWTRHQHKGNIFIYVYTRVYIYIYVIIYTYA